MHTRTLSLYLSLLLSLTHSRHLKGLTQKCVSHLSDTHTNIFRLSLSFSLSLAHTRTDLSFERLKSSSAGVTLATQTHIRTLCLSPALSFSVLLTHILVIWRTWEQQCGSHLGEGDLWHVPTDTTLSFLIALHCLPAHAHKGVGSRVFLSHVTRVNEVWKRSLACSNWYTCILFDCCTGSAGTHTPRSHVTRMNESCYTYEWVMSHVVWMSHVARMNKSCHTYAWAVSHAWMRHVTSMNQTCHTYEWVMSHVWMGYLHTHESCHAWVMSHMSHVAHESCHTRGMSNIQVQHIVHVLVSFLFCVYRKLSSTYIENSIYAQQSSPSVFPAYIGPCNRM